MLAPSDASRNRTLPGYGMLLEIGRCQVGSDGCSPHQMLLDTGGYRVCKDGGSPQMVARGFLQFLGDYSFNSSPQIQLTQKQTLCSRNAFNFLCKKLNGSGSLQRKQ